MIIPRAGICLCSPGYTCTACIPAVKPAATNGAIDLAGLLRAALNQPKPTKRLRKAVNAILDAMQHELSTKARNDRPYIERTKTQREIL